VRRGEEGGRESEGEAWGVGDHPGGPA